MNRPRAGRRSQPMTDPAGPDADVRIVLDSDTSPMRLTLTSPHGPRRVVARLRTSAEIQAGCRKLGRVIADVADQFRDGRPSSAFAIKQLSRLASAGRTFLIESALRDAEQDTFLLCDLLQRALIRRRPVHGSVPVIRTVGPPEYFFPWELLPLLEPLPVVAADNRI